MKVKSESEVAQSCPTLRDRLFVTPWTAAYQAPPSMEFSRQEYWSGVPLPHFRPTQGRTLCPVPRMIQSRRGSLSYENWPLKSMPGEKNVKIHCLVQNFIMPENFSLPGKTQKILTQVPLLESRRSLPWTHVILHVTMEFPRGPVAKTPHSKCRVSGFNPWSGD